VSVAGRTRRGPTVTSYHVQLSDGQKFTVIADARRARRRAAQPLCALAQQGEIAMTVLLRRFQS
jgi:hypothetical protein